MKLATCSTSRQAPGHHEPHPSEGRTRSVEGPRRPTCHTSFPVAISRLVSCRKPENVHQVVQVVCPLDRLPKCTFGISEVLSLFMLHSVEPTHKSLKRVDLSQNAHGASQLFVHVSTSDTSNISIWVFQRLWQWLFCIHNFALELCTAHLSVVGKRIGRIYALRNTTMVIEDTHIFHFGGQKLSIPD